MTTTYPLTVAFRKDHELQEKNDSQPKALLLSSQKKQKGFVCGQEDGDYITSYES